MKHLIFGLTIFFSLSACLKKTTTTDIDLSILEHSKVKKSISEYITRNPLSNNAVYYIDINKSRVTTFIEISTIIYTSYLISSNYCKVYKAYNYYILITSKSCKTGIDKDNYEKIYSRLIEDSKNKYSVRANGDTVLNYERVFYNPEIFKMYILEKSAPKTQ